MNEASNLIWIDLEMTGLDPDFDRIIEIATLVTDPQLNVIAEGPNLVIHQPDTLLDALDEWNATQHGGSGLLDRVRASVITEADAEKQTLAFLQKHVAAGQSPMCGNSICLDRRFLYRYMPTLEQYFHYRLIDVSTIKELARCWAPSILDDVNKDAAHRAMDDIRASIAECLHYRQHFFKF